MGGILKLYTWEKAFNLLRSAKNEKAAIACYCSLYIQIPCGLKCPTEFAGDSHD